MARAPAGVQRTPGVVSELEAPTSLRIHARILPVVAGFLDAVGYLALLKVFVAHMTGTTVLLGIGLGRGEWRTLLTAGLAIPFFLSGVLVGFEIERRAAQREFQRPLALQLGAETVLLSAFTAIGVTIFRDEAPKTATAGYILLLFLATCAMGIQTAALRKLGSLPLRTTSLTGNIAKAMEEIEKFIADPARRSERAQKLTVLASVWLVYLLGAVFGAIALDRFDLWCLLLPIVVLIGSIIWELKRPDDATTD